MTIEAAFCIRYSTYCQILCLCITEKCEDADGAVGFNFADPQALVGLIGHLLKEHPGFPPVFAFYLKDFVFQSIGYCTIGGYFPNSIGEVLFFFPSEDPFRFLTHNVTETRWGSSRSCTSIHSQCATKNGRLHF